MKTFYYAYTCKGNVGDLLINKYQIEEYAKYGDVYVDCIGMPDEFRRVILDGKNPHVIDFVATYGMSYRGKNMFKVLKLLKQEGFTHFTKSPGPYAVLSLPLKQLMVRLLGAKGYITAKEYGMKVFALGIDIDYDRVPQWLKRWNIRYFNHYDILGLRSIPNRDKMLSDVSVVQYCPDMAFLCPDLKSPEAIIRKRIALSFRKVEEEKLLMTHLHHIAKHFSDLGYAIDIVYQVEEDSDYCHLIAKELAEYKPLLRKEIISFDELKEYENYDFVFSNRLHVLLMSAMHGAIPFALISHCRKEQKIANIWNSVFSAPILVYIDQDSKTVKRLLNDVCKSNTSTQFEELLKQQKMCKEYISNLYSR